MGASSICCLVLALQMVSLVSATSRPFAPNNGAGVHQAVTAGQSLQSLQALLDSNFDPQFGPEKKDIEIKEGMMMNEAAAADYAKGIAKIGSTPPSCEHKCHGCSPCEPIQVPTISKTDNHHLNVNYANYEPEGWKCKCGPSFYSP
uniref:Epidermal patterning factor-like protein n=1 Tax=Salix viminalis TaxID=40686 RepID=A0A6N2NGR7_SALVM